MSDKIVIQITINGKKMLPITMAGEWQQSIFYKEEERLYNSGWLYQKPTQAICRYGFSLDRRKEGK